MQFAVLTRRKTEQFSDDQFGPILAPEAEHARELYAKGFIRHIWTHDDTPGAFMMVEADNEPETRQNLTTLPLYQAGISEIVAIVELKPYRGFSPNK